MPGWQKRFEPLWKAGKIQLVGIVQEQYADRARLYAQWRGIKWPILVDSLNLYGIKVVPIPMALDEAGCVVIDRIRGGNRGNQEFEKFLAAPKAGPVSRRKYRARGGVGGFLDGKPGALAMKGSKGFAKGVACQVLADRGKEGYALRAVKSWQRALEKDPNNYIYRRRLQQYGPRLKKPYNFYGWVKQARKEITARGEKPRSLRTEPLASETSGPRAAIKERHLDPDPDGKIRLDWWFKEVSIEIVMVPPFPKPGDTVRLRFFCRLNHAKWNDEGEALTITVPGTVTNAALVSDKGTVRILECDYVIPPEKTEAHWAYALYDVCSDADGTCQYLRQNIRLPTANSPAKSH